MTATDTALDSCLTDIAHVLGERVRPELVLLFGSRARGTAREDSDFDLMIVVRDPAVLESSRLAAYEALRELQVSADVLGRSVEEYERRQHDPGFMDWMIAREGVVLYTTGLIPQRSPERVRETDPSEDSLAMWMQRAASDINAADALLASTNPSIDAICFHAHAAVEKWLKALIVVHTQVFPPKTHELPTLLALLPEDIRSDAAMTAACAMLMTVYPKSRYPEAGMPSASEATEAVEAAQTVRTIAAARLPGYA